jgi:hypothetical protein
VDQVYARTPYALTTVVDWICKSNRPRMCVFLPCSGSRATLPLLPALFARAIRSSGGIGRRGGVGEGPMATVTALDMELA